MGVAVCALAIGGCALNAPRPFVCDATTGSRRPISQGNTPLSRWTAECAKAIGEASWPPRHAEGLDGTVVVKAFYNRNGRPTRIEVTSSSGSELLDAHAKKTIQRATCPFVPRSVTQTELSLTTSFRYGKMGPPCAAPIAAPPPASPAPPS